MSQVKAAGQAVKIALNERLKSGDCLTMSHKLQGVQGDRVPLYLDLLAKSGASLIPTPINQGLPVFTAQQFDLNGQLLRPAIREHVSSIPDIMQHHPECSAEQTSFSSFQLPLGPCPSWVTLGACENHHRFAKILYCGKEYCELCGKDWSETHKRRFARWLPKARQLNQMGYLVITFPKESRSKLRTKKSLSSYRSLIIHYIKRNIARRGLVRWHWFGDKSHDWHPHLNLLLDGARLTKSQLNSLRSYLSNLFQVPELVVHYQYTAKTEKMVHWLKYVTRATFKDAQWDEEMTEELKGYRNQSSFGNWKDASVWIPIPEETEFEHIISLQSGKCPLCNARLHWSSKPVSIRYLTWSIDEGHATPCGCGYFMFKEHPPNI